MVSYLCLTTIQIEIDVDKCLMYYREEKEYIIRVRFLEVREHQKSMRKGGDDKKNREKKLRRSL